MKKQTVAVTERPEMMSAFVIAERKNGKDRWIEIGRAFVNKDGSINIFLDALPVGGKIQLRTQDRRS